MALTTEVYQCKKTGKALEVVKSEGIQPASNHPQEKDSLIYHGNTLEFLAANTSEGAKEKHMPVAAFEGDRLVVKVGDVMHPMSSEHLIEWVTILYDNFMQRGSFCSEESPQITFYVGDAKKVDVYAYCNLHGLWKTTISK